MSDTNFQARNYLRVFLNSKHAKLLLKLHADFYTVSSKADSVPN